MSSKIPPVRDSLSADVPGDTNPVNQAGSKASQASKRVRTVVRGVITPMINMGKQMERKKRSKKYQLEILKMVIESIIQMKTAVAGFLDSIRPGVEFFVLYDTIGSHATILLCILIAWLGGKLGLGILFAIIICLSSAATLERINNRRKRSYESYMADREITMKQIPDGESLNWFNLLLKRIWVGLESGISESAKAAINDVLQYYRPPILHDLFLSVFTLGSAAPRIINIRASSSNESSVDLICDVEFIPPIDLPSEGSASASESKKGSGNARPSGSKIVLTAKIGGGPVPISLPVSVNNIELRGILNVHLDFIMPFPHVKKLGLSFRDTPSIDFDLRPLKTLDVMDLGVLSKLIKDMVKSILSCCIVVPNQIDLDMEEILIGANNIDVEAPVGVLEILIAEGRGIKNVEFAGKTDPYVIVKIGGREVAKTKYIMNTLDPLWNEKFYIPVTTGMLVSVANGSDVLELVVYDSNNINKDTIVGTSQTLKLLPWLCLGGSTSSYLRDAGISHPEIGHSEAMRLARSWGPPFSPYTGPIEVTKKIFSSEKLNNHTCTGEVIVSLSFTPVICQIPPSVPPAKPTVIIPSLEEPVLFRAVLLDGTALSAPDRASVHCNVYLDKVKIHQCISLRKGSNPQWNSSICIYTKNQKFSLLYFSFSNSGKNLGSVAVNMRDIFETPNKKEYTLSLKSSNNFAAKVRFNFYLYPLDSDYIPEKEFNINALGLVKVDIISASNLQNLELVGKSDPYAKVYIDDRFIGMTHVKVNTIDPRWDETFYSVCYDYSELLKINLWDSNNIKKDRFLGAISYSIGEITNSCSSEVAEISPTCTIPDSLIPRAPSLKSVSTPSKLISGAINDGLKIKAIDNHQFDVWSPVYLLRPEHGHSTTDIQNIDTPSESDVSVRDPTLSNVNYAQDISGSERMQIRQSNNGNFSGIDFISKRLRSGDSSRPKYRGFLHLSISLYKTEKDMVINARPDSFYYPEYDVGGTDHENLDETGLPPNSENEEIIVDNTPENMPPNENNTDDKSTGEKDALNAQTDLKNENDPIVDDECDLETKIDDPLTQESIDPLGRIKSILRTYHSAIITFWIHYFEYFERNIDNSVSNVYTEIVVGDHAVWRSRVINHDNLGKYNWLQCFDKYVAYATSQNFRVDIKSAQNKTPSNDDNVVGSFSLVLTSDTVGRAKKLFDVESSSKVIGQLCMSLTYSPIDSTVFFDSSESSGVLYCDIVSAENMDAVDSDGLSDPYVVVLMNGKRIVKTKAINNCLSPVWNKSFSVEISNRLRTTIEFQVKDQNMFTKNKILGVVRFNLATTVVNGSIIIKEFMLEDARNGSLLLRLLFLPKEIKDLGIKTLKSAEKVDELNVIDRNDPSGMKKIRNVIGNTIISGPARVGKLLDQVASINKAFERNKDAGTSGAFSLLTLAEEFGIPVINNSTSHQGQNDFKKQSVSMSMSSLISYTKHPYSGKVDIQIIAAEGIRGSESGGKYSIYIKLKQVIHGKEKVVHKTQTCRKKDSSCTWDNEHAHITIPPEKIRMLVLHKNSIGKDVVLGECTMNILEIISNKSEGEYSNRSWIYLTAGSGTGKVLVSVDRRT